MTENMRQKLIQLVCKHKDKELISWDWDYTITRQKLSSLTVKYHCPQCNKMLISSLNGKEASDFATIMSGYKQI